MIGRRRALCQIIAIGMAPPIVRASSLMRINSTLGLTPDDYSIDMGDFDAALRGVIVLPSQDFADALGGGLVLRSFTSRPIKLGGYVLLSGEKKVVSKSLSPLFPVYITRP